MMRRLSFMLPVVAIITLAGCDWFKSKPSEATAEKAGLKVVNVLDKALYNDAHIKGSIQVNFEEVKDAAQAWNKKDPVVFYCSNYMCQASFEAARQLKDMGFEQAMAYEGGMEEWYRLNQEGDATFAYEGPATQDYLKIKVAKPEHMESSVKIVSAPELKEMMHTAGLL